jgi:uncharacterized membrane protein
MCGIGKLWQVVHVTETLTHALMEFLLAGTLTCTARLICMSTCLSCLACVCKLMKFVQCASMQFCFIFGKTAAEMLEMLVTAYLSDTVTKKTVFKWFQRFQEGNESLKLFIQNLFPELIWLIQHFIKKSCNI